MERDREREKIEGERSIERERERLIERLIAHCAGCREEEQR